MDVDTAFLYGEMTDEPELYIPVPDGYPIPAELQSVDRSQLVARIDKAIYGLKQSPRLWNAHIDRTMTSHGFTKSPYDPCLYQRTTMEGVVYVTIYVDDLIIAASSQRLIDTFKRELHSVYAMKDLGELKYCLGMEISRDRRKGTITLTQSKYINDVLTRFRLSGDGKTELCPMQAELKVSQSMSPQPDRC